jgi:hypothetical protein
MMSYYMPDLGKFRKDNVSKGWRDLVAANTITTRSIESIE